MLKQKNRILAAILVCFMVVCNMPVQAYSKNVLETSFEQDGFRYEQEFEQDAMKVVLQAAKGVIPKEAEVNITLLNDRNLVNIKNGIQKKMQDETVRKKALAEPSGRTIFDRYSDLQVSVKQAFAFDFEITYEDREGNLCIFEPAEGQSVNISVEIGGLEGTTTDEMQQAAAFYVPDPYAAENGRRFSSEEGEMELLAEEETAQKDSISFSTDHFSVYTIAVLEYKASADEEMIAAEEKAWDIINSYADAEYFLEDPYKDTMTNEQYGELQQAAIEATKECVTPYEKIKAVTGFVAERTYYDYKYYNYKYRDKKEDESTIEIPNLYVDPYDVYQQKRTICDGYARLVNTLLVSIGIPCMKISGWKHAYNAAYDSVNQKWIFADATWCSRNQYTDNDEWIYGGFTYERYDLSPQEIAKLTSHEVYSVNGLLDQTINSTYYSMETNHASAEEESDEKWKKCDWYLSVSGVKQEKAKAVPEFAGLRVQNVKAHSLRENSKIKSMDLSDTQIASIDEGAFYQCVNLAEIKFPAALSKVSKGSFWGCTSLKEIDLSATQVEQIEYAAFWLCSSADAIKLPPTIKKVDEFGFGCAQYPLLITFLVGAPFGIDLGIGEGTAWQCRFVIPCPYVYTVKFDGNGALNGEMPPIRCAGNVSKKLPKNTFQHSQYVFAGWNTRPDGTGIHLNDMAEIKNLGMQDDAEVVLYAQWGYRIIYKLNGGKNNSKNLPYYRVNAANTDLKSPSRTGYSFAGWFSDKKMTKKVSQIKQGSSGNLTLYAKWKPNKYKVKFIANHKSATGKMKVITCTYGKKKALPANKYKAAGYRFVGWSTKKNGKGKIYKNKAKVKNLSAKSGKTVKLYGKWKKI